MEVDELFDAWECAWSGRDPARFEPLCTPGFQYEDPLTPEPEAQCHTTVAVDREDRVWVAWDEADRNWGKDFSRSSAAPGSRGLHYSRGLGVRAWANGRVQKPSADLTPVLTGRMTRYAELPHLAIDGSGALWMVFRHWTASRWPRCWWI